jgi:(2Fe-2S) ferredoxin
MDLPTPDASLPPPAKGSACEAAFAKMRLHEARRHAWLCVGPDCCTSAEGEASWAALKAACKATDAPALRSRAACLRVCSEGPWLLVYPEGIWYPRATPERIEQIVREHLAAGRPITDWALHAQPLRG